MRWIRPFATLWDTAREGWDIGGLPRAMVAAFAIWVMAFALLGVTIILDVAI